MNPERLVGEVVAVEFEDPDRDEATAITLTYSDGRIIWLQPTGWEAEGIYIQEIKG